LEGKFCWLAMELMFWNVTPPMSGNCSDVFVLETGACVITRNKQLYNRSRYVTAPKISMVAIATNEFHQQNDVF
jgi:hypothetical protein